MVNLTLWTAENIEDGDTCMKSHCYIVNNTGLQLLCPKRVGDCIVFFSAITEGLDTVNNNNWVTMMLLQRM